MTISKTFLVLSALLAMIAPQVLAARQLTVTLFEEEDSDEDLDLAAPTPMEPAQDDVPVSATEITTSAPEPVTLADDMAPMPDASDELSDGPSPATGLMAGKEGCETITSKISTMPDLSSMAKALEKAPALAAELDGMTEDFTVFCPSNTALEMIPKEDLDALLDNPEALAETLELHVVPAAYLLEDFMDGEMLETLTGDNLTISVTPETVSVKAPGDSGTVGAVTESGTIACNGVMHVIDMLLVPGEDDVVLTRSSVGGAYGVYGKSGGYGQSGVYGSAVGGAYGAYGKSGAYGKLEVNGVYGDLEDTADAPMGTMHGSGSTHAMSPMHGMGPTPGDEDNDDDDEYYDDGEDDEDDDVQAPVEVVPESGGGGEFTICMNGEKEFFGFPEEEREYEDKGEGVWVYKDGRCELEEWAGGFDGYPSPKVNDGDEKGLDQAIIEMFPSGEPEQNKFLQAMIKEANPVNLEFPADEKIADDYQRADNIHALSAACTKLITVTSCEV